jgi:hypothetical protein
MPKTHCCEICSFQTEKKSTFNDHLTSKKHLNKVNGVASSTASSVTTSVDETTNSSTASRIRELEHQILIMRTEYELKLQHKDEIISILKEQINNKTAHNNIELKVEEKQIPEKQKIQTPKIPTIEFLHTHLEHAPTIQQCYQMLKNDESNDYIMEANVNNEPTTLLNPKYIRKSSFKLNPVANAIEIIINFFSTFETNQLPFYCSNKRKNILYLKTDNGWIKQTEQNTDEFNKLLLDFAKKALWSVQSCIVNCFNKFKPAYGKFKELYEINYIDWVNEHWPQLIDCLSFRVGDCGKGEIETKESKEDKELVIKFLKIELSKLSPIKSICEVEED